MSDALTDIYRSEMIAKMANNLVEAEKKFLTEPTRENLEKLYSSCDELMNHPRGYWGEDYTGLAKNIKDSYISRFESKKNYKITLDDIANFLDRIKPDGRMFSLADLDVRFRGIDAGSNEYVSELKRTIHHIKENLSVASYHELKGDVDGKKLRKILDEAELDWGD